MHIAWILHVYVQPNYLAKATAWRYYVSRCCGCVGVESRWSRVTPQIPTTTTNTTSFTASMEISVEVRSFNEGWFATPMFLTGNHPKYLKKYTSTFLRNFKANKWRSSMVHATYIYMTRPQANFYMAPDKGFNLCLL
jgi:hypothetical protein